MIEQFLKWLFGVGESQEDYDPTKDEKLQQATAARERMEHSVDLTIELKANWMARELMKKKAA